MAFLCPVRIRRGKKKKSLGSDVDKDLSRPSSGLGLNHGMGRITGSASIETLVRVGIEKEHGLSPDSKMVVLHDFTPCVDDELEVKRGQIVNILYRENDWVYVIGQDTRQEGFIPHSYCAPYNTQLADLAIKKKLPRDQSLGHTTSDLTDVNVPDISAEILDENTSGLVGLQTSLKHSQASLSSEPDFLPFSKDPSGRYIVLYTFIARDENDVSVERGEFVTVLNREDPDWFWIVRSDGQEGFIPSGFVYPADNVLHGTPKSVADTSDLDTTTTTSTPTTTTLTMTMATSTATNTNIISNSNSNNNINNSINNSINNIINSNNNINNNINSNMNSNIHNNMNNNINNMNNSINNNINNSINNNSINNNSNNIISNTNNVISNNNNNNISNNMVISNNSIISNNNNNINNNNNNNTNIINHNNMNNNNNNMNSNNINSNNNNNNNIVNSNNNNINNTNINNTNINNIINDNMNENINNIFNNDNNSSSSSPNGPSQVLGSEDLRYHGTELVMLYDYKAQAPDDLSVRRGDWIYADLNNQTVDGWLWAYAPKTRKYGFIPKAYARPPAMTSL